MSSAVCRKETVYSRREIEDLIAQGRHIIIVDGKVLKTDAWNRFHPGGEKAIKHMVGRDATDEVNALHSPEARQRMQAYQIGVIKGPWKNFLPPIQGGHFRRLPQVDVQCHENPTADDQDENRDSTSSDDSEAPSPIFDKVPKFEKSSSMRRRPYASAESVASSASSVTSLELDVPEEKTKTWSVDSYTKEERDSDLRRFPSLNAGVQSDIVQKYRILNDRIRAEGLYQCDYSAYAKECVRYILFFGACLWCLHMGWYCTAGLFLGMFWHQIVFTAHDAGHMGITHDFQTDTIIGIIVTDFLGGLSMGWWKRSHNVHHIVTNSPEHDPDIEHMPFFAVSHRFFDSLRSTYHEKIMTYDAFAKFMVRYQHYMYYPLLTVGRFNLYRLSWGHLLFGHGPKKGPAAWHRWFEIAGNAFFWAWFGYGMVYRSIPTSWARFGFVMISHMVTMILHVQITLSHFAMSTADFGVDESFPQRMLRTTMDVDCPEWLDFFHGGLQFQAIHHLYPRLPRHSLRRTQKLVQEFCKDVEIPYALYGFVEGNKQVISRLGDVGKQAAILAECQKSVAGMPLDAH